MVRRKHSNYSMTRKEMITTAVFCGAMVVIAYAAAWIMYILIK